jgi:glycerophosphoryl diester phosphodiesterase
MRFPQLVAHRGYPLHYPENTIVGIEAAIRAGAKYIEVDVQLSRDRVPVLFHDRSLKRICGADGAVHEYIFSQLQSFRARDFDRFGYKYSDVRVPALTDLRQLLERHPDVTAFVELKRNSIDRFGGDVVLQRVHENLVPVLRQCVLISYSLDALLSAHRRGWPRLGAVIDRWRERKQESISRIRPEHLFCDVSGLPRFGKLKANGAKLVVFEITDPKLALNLCARGVDFIETFAFGELQAELELATAGDDRD